jgi:hypothetical protein
MAVGPDEVFKLAGGRPCADRIARRGAVAAASGPLSENTGPGAVAPALPGALTAPCAYADDAHPAATRRNGNESERKRCGIFSAPNAAKVDIKILFT